MCVEKKLLQCGFLQGGSVLCVETDPTSKEEVTLSKCKITSMKRGKHEIHAPNSQFHSSVTNFQVTKNAPHLDENEAYLTPTLFQTNMSLHVFGIPQLKYFASDFFVWNKFE